MTDLPMTRGEMKDALRQLPGEDGWFHTDNEGRVVHLGNELVNRGLSPQRAYDALAAMYQIITDEYGD